MQYLCFGFSAQNVSTKSKTSIPKYGHPGEQLVTDSDFGMSLNHKNIAFPC